MIKQIADDYSMVQLVREPTRNEYLLDLFLTSIDQCKVSVLPSVADHKAIMGEIKIPHPKELVVARSVWHFKGAAWSKMKSELANISWH